MQGEPNIPGGGVGISALTDRAGGGIGGGGGAEWTGQYSLAKAYSREEATGT